MHFREHKTYGVSPRSLQVSELRVSANTVGVGTRQKLIVERTYHMLYFSMKYNVSTVIGRLKKIELQNY